ncbi:TPA: hypothetical protein KC498_004589 [Escherichia coli O146]|nr:hypothetical protein [Escherichia coli O146]
MTVILPLVVAPERDDRHYPAGAVVLWCCGAVVLWCCGAVVLWCCGAGWLCYVHWCNVTGHHGDRRHRCGGCA